MGGLLSDLQDLQQISGLLGPVQYRDAQPSAAEMRSYDPTWIERIGGLIRGDAPANTWEADVRGRLARGLIGTSGLGREQTASIGDISGANVAVDAVQAGAEGRPWHAAAYGVGAAVPYGVARFAKALGAAERPVNPGRMDDFVEAMRLHGRAFNKQFPTAMDKSEHVLPMAIPVAAAGYGFDRMGISPELGIGAAAAGLSIDHVQDVARFYGRLRRGGQR